jgi:hypothetical protein
VSRLLLRRQDGLVTAAQGSTSTVSRSSRSNSSRGLVDLSGTLHNPGTVHADRGPGRGGFPSAPLSSIYHMIVKNEGPLTEASIRLNTERQLTRAHGAPLLRPAADFIPAGPLLHASDALGLFIELSIYNVSNPRRKFVRFQARLSPGEARIA